MAVATLASPPAVPAGTACSPPPRGGEAGPPRPTAQLAIDDLPVGRPRFTELLHDLRGDIGLRPVVDAGLAGGLRAWLEDGVADAVNGSAPDTRPVLLTSGRLRSLVGGEDRLECDPKEPAPTARVARGVLVSLLFRQLVTTGHIDDPMRDALSALDVEPSSSEIIQFVAALDLHDRAALASELDRHAAMLRQRWTALPGHWLPRTRERITVPLGGGRVVLSMRVDLLVGTPCAGRASVCLVLVRSGQPRPADLTDLHFAALLETLRSGAPPFRAVLHYSESGLNRIEDVTEGNLARAVQRTIDGLAARAADPRCAP
jgi:hypothetical protein